MRGGNVSDEPIRFRPGRVEQRGDFPVHADQGDPAKHRLTRAQAAAIARGRAQAWADRRRRP